MAPLQWPTRFLLGVCTAFFCLQHVNAATCPVICPIGRVIVSGSTPDQGYCTINFAKNCTTQHTECPSCSLFKPNCNSLSTRFKQCIGFGRAKQSGYYLEPDDSCGGGKYKIIASQALTGVESALDATPAAARDHNYLFQQLWLSSLSASTQPCAHAVNYAPFPSGAGALRTGAMQNAAGYRSKHQWHAHVGAAKPEFEACVATVAARAKARRKWAPGPCQFTWSNAAGTATRTESVQVWVYLEPAPSTTSAPSDVASVVQKAGRPAGPVGKYVAANADRRLFTGVAVTGVQWARPGAPATALKPHFAIMLYNYHDAWANAKAGGHFFQLGEYELLVH